jgi:hypothetical protein
MKSAKLIQGNADYICLTPTASPKNLFIGWLTISVKTTDTIIGYSGSKRKILIVDDRWENRAVFVNILEPIGFELEEVADEEIANFIDRYL